MSVGEGEKVLVLVATHGMNDVRQMVSLIFVSTYVSQWVRQRLVERRAFFLSKADPHFAFDSVVAFFPRHSLLSERRERRFTIMDIRGCTKAMSCFSLGCRSIESLSPKDGNPALLEWDVLRQMYVNRTRKGDEDPVLFDIMHERDGALEVAVYKKRKLC